MSKLFKLIRNYCLNEEELWEDFLFYKQFFYNHLQVFHDYLQNKKNKLSELKNKLDEEGREWLEFYCESQQEKIEESYYIEFDSYDSLGVARSYGPVVTALVLRLSVFVIVILNIGEGWKKERKQ